MVSNIAFITPFITVTKAKVKSVQVSFEQLTQLVWVLKSNDLVVVRIVAL